MSDKEIDVRVTANTADLKRGMSEAPGAVEAATSRIRGAFRTMQEETRNTLHGLRNDISAQVSGMAGPFSGLVDVLGTVKGGFIAVAAAAAMIGFSKSVNEAAQMTESAMDLSRALGITTNEASVLQAALDDVGASPAEFEAAAKGLSRQLRSNEDDMRALGLATRDANGNLRPMSDLMLDGIQILGQYREGADRAIAAQTLFGRGVDTSSKLLLLNRDALDENRAAVEELGLMVGENAVEAWKDYDAATDRAGLSVKGMVKAVGQSLMPVLTDLIKLFNAVMPAAIVVVKGALSGLTAAFLAVKNGVVVLWETINALVVTVAEPIRALAEAIWRAANGDFKGAGEAIKGIGGNVAGAWERAMQRIADSSAKTSSQIKGLFVPDSAAARGGTSGDSTAGEDAGGTKGGKAGKTQGPIDVFDNGSFVTSDKGVADFIRKQQEAINSLYGDMARDAEKAAQAAEAAFRKSAQQQMQIDLIRAQSARDAELARIQEAEAAAQHQVNMGAMTNETLLALQAQFNAERLATEQQFIDAKKQIEMQDPDRNPVEFERLEAEKEEIRRRYAAQASDIQRQQALESQTTWQSLADSIAGLWDQGTQALMNGTLTWANAVKAIGATVLKWFLNDFIGGKVKAWITGEAAQTAATKTGTATRGAIEGVASLKSIALWAKTAVTNIMTSAYEAMAAAWKAIVGIPYVGPFLAPVAAGAAFAGVSAIANKVTASAAGGYDIPAGTNPITQLHEREMVLPAKHADVIRSMAEGGGGAEGGGFAPVFNISTLDAGGVRDFLMTNQAALVDALRNAHRNGMR